MLYGDRRIASLKTILKISAGDLAGALAAHVQVGNLRGP